MFGGMVYFIVHFRVNAVNQPHEYCFPRLPDNAENGNRNDQPDNGIGERNPKIYADGTDEYGKARQPVHPGMMAISYERWATASLPMNPRIDAATTAQRKVISCGWKSRSMET